MHRPTLNRRHVAAVLAAAVLTRPALAQTPLTFADIYLQRNEFPEKLRALERQPVTMRGYMAPPLKAEARFFVLTRMPMATCPFCGSETDWPDDIVVVTTPEPITPVPFNRPVVAAGVLELGSRTDPETGFLSRVRIVDGSFRRA